MDPPALNPLTTQLESIQTIMNDINRKIDLVTKKETEVEKRLDNFDKRIVGLTRQVIKVNTESLLTFLFISRSYYIKSSLCFPVQKLNDSHSESVIHLHT